MPNHIGSDAAAGAGEDRQVELVDVLAQVVLEAGSEAGPPLALHEGHDALQLDGDGRPQFLNGEASLGGA